MKEIFVMLQESGYGPMVKEVTSLEEAATAVVQFQTERCLGASGVGAHHGTVQINGRSTHKVSYNGLVWPL